MKLPKYLKHLETPGILAFYEDDCNRFYVCRTPQEYCKAAMQVLKHRLESGWFYHDEEDESDPELNTYVGITQKRKNVRKDKTEAQTIVQNNDLLAAYEFMDYRSDHEYERMSIENIETIE